MSKLQLASREEDYEATALAAAIREAEVDTEAVMNEPAPKSRGRQSPAPTPGAARRTGNARAPRGSHRHRAD